MCPDFEGPDIFKDVFLPVKIEEDSWSHQEW